MKNETIKALYNAMEEAWKMSDEAWDNDDYILSGDLREVAIDIGNFMTNIIERLDNLKKD